MKLVDTDTGQFIREYEYRIDIDKTVSTKFLEQSLVMNRGLSPFPDTFDAIS